MACTDSTQEASHGELTYQFSPECNIGVRLSRFKLAGPPTPRDTEVSNAYAIIHDSLGPVCICSLIGINSDVQYWTAHFVVGIWIEDKNPAAFIARCGLLPASRVRHI